MGCVCSKKKVTLDEKYKIMLKKHKTTMLGRPRQNYVKCNFEVENPLFVSDGNSSSGNNKTS